MTKQPENEAITRLSGAVAHELNGALTVVAGSIETLIEAVRHWQQVPPQAYQALDHVKRGAGRIAELAARLQGAAGQQELLPEPLHVGEFLRTMGENIGRRFGNAVRPALSVPADVWNVRADPQQLEMAILNLAANAHEAMPLGGKLAIEVANVPAAGQTLTDLAPLAAGEYVKIAVQDTGEGMSPEVLKRAAEISFTANRPPTHLGLGLSHAASFAALSGGALRVKSERGAGTTVELYLPRCLALTGANAASLTPVKSGAGSILLVEDDEDILEYIVEALEQLNYAVAVARNAREALACIEKKALRFDLLLTDMTLPGTLGDELAAEVLKRQPDIGVLFMSGQGRDTFPRAKLLAKAGWIAKPMTKAMLDERIRRALADRAPGYGSAGA